MSSPKIARLRPRARSFQAAVTAFRAGQFEVCLETVEDGSSTESVTLAARSLIRLNRPADAVAKVAAALQTTVNLAHRERAELEMLHATALARAGKLAEAACAFDETRPYVFSAASPDLEAEFYHLEAHAQLLNRDFERSRKTCLEALAPAPRVYGIRNHFTPLRHTRARIFDVLAALSAAEGDFAGQRAHLKSACEEMNVASVADDSLKAAVLATFSMLVRESGEADDIAYVRTTLQSIPSIAELLPSRYTVLQSLAWAGALAGDHLGAFRDLRAAADAAPTIVLKVSVSLDKAYLARELRQLLTAGEEIDYAERLCESVCWENVSAEQINVLLKLSRTIAPENAARARRFYAHYRRLRKVLTWRHAGFFDERAQLDEIVADATICRAEGNLGRATLLFEQTFEKWKELGYDWRAALAAIELAELGAGSHYAEFALAEAAHRPNSWFASRARALRIVEPI